MSFRTKREKVISARTSATSGTSTPKTVTEVDSVPLDEFEELLIDLNITTALVGTTPTMDIYLQRGLVPNPDPATDADWEDIYAFLQIATSLVRHVTHLPLQRGEAVETATGHSHMRTLEALTADSVRIGYWGDQLRIREKMGGTVTTEAVYDLSVTGKLRSPK
ncbi:hypothetical protein LCGC14_2576160 [marine sediment metagenome]|uniref:Uncharacterized protein n=1 Tax=marine sediment metagenome TaxID=412755 RepID=A0A0F9AFV3_9ZZZZ